MKYDYYIIDSMYSVDECEYLRQKILENAVTEAYDRPADTSKIVDVKHFHYGSLKYELSKFSNCILDLNKNGFGFDLFQFNDYELLNYNEYDMKNNSHYGWHRDCVINEPYDIKLTALLNISNTDYEGGDFELFLNRPICIEKFKKPGSVLVFVSNIMHRVTPISKGKRMTISQWCTGPNWK